MLPIKPLYMGRFSSGTLYAKMMRAPEKIPAEPTPAMARPTMSAVLVGATPQMRLPSSKMMMVVM